MTLPHDGIQDMNDDAAHAANSAATTSEVPLSPDVQAVVNALKAVQDNSINHTTQRRYVVEAATPYADMDEVSALLVALIAVPDVGGLAFAIWHEVNGPDDTDNDERFAEWVNDQGAETLQGIIDNAKVLLSSKDAPMELDEFKKITTFLLALGECSSWAEKVSETLVAAVMSMGVARFATREAVIPKAEQQLSSFHQAFIKKLLPRLAESLSVMVTTYAPSSPTIQDLKSFVRLVGLLVAHEIPGAYAVKMAIIVSTNLTALPSDVVSMVNEI